MENDSEAGNRYYDHARSHDGGLGRFLSPDPLVGRVGAPQTWNRYSYARNNPLSFVDPDGRDDFAEVARSVNQGRNGRAAITVAVEYGHRVAKETGQAAEKSALAGAREGGLKGAVEGGLKGAREALPKAIVGAGKGMLEDAAKSGLTKLADTIAPGAPKPDLVAEPQKTGDIVVDTAASTVYDTGVRTPNEVVQAARDIPVISGGLLDLTVRTKINVVQPNRDPNAAMKRQLEAEIDSGH